MRLSTLPAVLLLFLALLMSLALAIPAHAKTGRITSQQGYSFNLPRGWEAYKATANDGSYIVIPDRGRDGALDLWIYTRPIENPGAVEPSDGRVEPFVFADGGMGRKRRERNTITYTRIIGFDDLTLSVSAPGSWIKRNRKNIEALAKSMRAGQASVALR